MFPPRMEHGVAIAAVRGNGQDRAGVFDAGDDVVIALADGAGGNGNGATASRAVIDAAAAAATAIHDWCALLAELDRDPRRLGHGESTAVIVSIRGGAIAGASVGDSGAWLVRGTDVIDLTEGQLRKPLVGGGCAPFRLRSTRVTGGTLLVASDGLFNYAKPSDIVRLASGADLTVAARALVELVRLPNGALQDDVAVVLCRERA